MSNIRDTDLLLVTRSGSSFKCSRQDIANARDTDTFLISRGGVSNQCSKANIGTNVRDDDVVLVTRGGVAYKATGADLKGIFGPSSSGVTGTATNWSTALLSTNDPSGIQNPDRLFEPLASQNLSRYGKCNPTYYIQIDLPFSQPWTNGNYSRFTVDVCEGGDINIYASTNVTGQGNFTLVRNQNIVSPGKVTITQTAYPLNGATEIYAVRYESNNLSQGVSINNFGTSEHGNWRVGATGGNSYGNADMQLKDTDKYIYLPVSNLDTSTLNTGDTISVVGGSATGKVYKVIDGSTVLMSLNSTDPWPSGSIAVTPA